MTNIGAEPGPPRSVRGARRRAALVEAGVAVLAEAGWAAVTTHAVARRAGVNQGLVHYHLGSLAELRAAVAARASAESVGEIIAELVAHTDEAGAVGRLAEALGRPDTGARRATALTIELVAESQRDPLVAAAVRAALADGRAQIAAWLASRHPDWTTDRLAGTAVLVAALVDGLVLHRVLDDELALREALDVLATAVTPPTP